MKWIINSHVSLELIESYPEFKVILKDFEQGTVIDSFSKSTRLPPMERLTESEIIGYQFKVNKGDTFFTTDLNFESYLTQIKDEEDLRYQVHSFSTDVDANEFLETVRKEDVHQIIPVPVDISSSRLVYVVVVKE
jgi:hypothetical protein